MVPARQRLLLRAAARIQRQYHDLAAADSRLPSLPEWGFSECQRLLGLVRLTRRRHWHQAGRRLRDRFRSAAERLQRELQSLAQHLHEGATAPFVPTLRQLYDELVALHDEFDDVEIVLRQNAVLVRTEPVVLDDVDLGPFEIRLEWGRLRCAPAYRVRALAPCSAAVDGRTVHPHVRSDLLCEGDGQRPIRKALAEGRLCDLFLIVSQILATYNPGSAYVSLDDWRGRECVDCGGIVSEEDLRECARCGDVACGDCCSLCAACSDYCCGDCVARYESCQDLYCDRCLSPCPHCEGALCDDCRAEHECPAEAPDERDNEREEPVDGAGAPFAEPEAGVMEEFHGVPAAAVFTGRLGAALVPPWCRADRDRRVRDLSPRRSPLRRGAAAGAAGLHRDIGSVR